MVSAEGDMGLRGHHPSLALFCSAKCPGSLILQAYDFCRSVRGDQVAIISGFHSAVEADCLEILMRGTAPIIVCPARRLCVSRLPREWRIAIEAGRMLLLSPFEKKQKRATAELAVARNRFVASIADEVLVAYANIGSKTEALCREIVADGKRVYTFNDAANEHLISMGAVPIGPDHFSKLQSGDHIKNEERPK